MVRQFILVVGPPGAGKTTISNHLVTLSGNTWACIHGDSFWSFMPAKDSHEFPHNYVAVMKALISSAIRFADSDYDVILDFPIHPKNLSIIPKFMKGKEIAVKYVVLVPPFEVSKERAMTREVGYVFQEEEYNQLAKMHSRFDLGEEAKGCAYDHATCKITNINGSAMETAQEIFDGLASGRFDVTFLP
jgi:energy-coupling factor transporter ATP-binding protein EcfA2